MQELTLYASPASLYSGKVRRCLIKTIAQPYRFFLLKRVQETVTALDDRARERVGDLLARRHMADVLAARLDREIGWADNREVWL